MLDDLDWCNIVRALTFAANFADEDNKELFLGVRGRVMEYKTWIALHNVTGEDIKEAIK